MSPMLLGLLSFAVITLLIFLGFHVGVVMILVAVIGIWIVRGPNTAFNVIQFVPYVSVASYTYAVFPLFILMGEFVASSGLANTLFDGFQAWFGRIKGGMGMAVAVLGAALGAVTGSAVAGAAMMTRVAFPEMIKRKYDPGVSAGIIAAASPLVIIIPPSIFLMFYAVLTYEDVGKCLLAGFIPGFGLAAIYMVQIFVMALRNPEKMPPADRKFSAREKIVLARNVGPLLLMGGLILGGLYGGIFTPSEAGGAGAFIALIFLLIMKRKKSGKSIIDSVWNAASMTSMIFFIIIGALMYGRFLALTGASEQIITSVGELPVSPYVIFAGIVIIFIILGCFLDAISMMAITLPIVHPLMKTLGFDPIWLGVMVVILIGLGTITPPFGIVVYTVKSLIGDKAELGTVFMHAVPFVISNVVVIILMTIFPQIVLFLPNLMS